MKKFAWLLASLPLLSIGCGMSSGTKYERDPMSDVGRYPPAPPDFKRVRVGVAKFKDNTGRNIGGQAAAQLETLVIRMNRFSVINRTRLDAMLAEQGLTGVVNPAELAQSGRVRGVDFLFAGNVTNFRITHQKSRSGFGIGRITKHLGVGGVDTSKVQVRTDVGVDVMLVNATTGEIVAKDFGEVTRTDSASAWGMHILGIGGAAKNEIRVDKDSQGKVLRWALDEVLRKMVNPIDRYFTNPNLKLPEREPAPKGKSGKGGKPAPRGGDYMPGHLYLAKKGARWQPAVMHNKPSGKKGEAHFTDVRTNDKWWTSDFVNTRPATKEDIKVGTRVFVINLWDKGHQYKTAGQAAKWWKDRFTYWDDSTVSDTVGLEQGIFQAPAAGKMRDVHLSNVRVVEEK